LKAFKNSKRKMLKLVTGQLCSAPVTARVTPVRFASWNPFSKKGGNKADIYEVPEESQEMEEYQKQIKMLEAEVREEYIESKRNKSRLSASDRQILQGRPPHVGVIFEYSDKHRSQKFKRSILGRYGIKSGVNPAIAWPSDKDLDLAREWESLYQPEPLSKTIEDIRLAEEAVIQKRKEREDKIDANLEKLEAQIKAWQNRVSSRNKAADNDRARREKVLAELKTEFGYDVNPEDESMKTRIAEREKALIKEERELKKKLRKEQGFEDKPYRRR